MTAVRSSRWEDASIAAAVLAVDPMGLAGISLRSAAGPVRDTWLSQCARMFPRDCAWLRIPLNVSDDRLLGGLDLSATLRAGHPVVERGILAQADGGVITLSMAERVTASTAAKIGSVLDQHEVRLERDGFARRIRSRFAVIALDEGIEADERPPASLLERLALHVDLNGIALSAALECHHDISRARKALSRVQVNEQVFEALCEVSAAFGVTSARAAWFALRAARALSALHGRAAVTEDDLALAVRLVFAPRALMAPCEPSPAEPNAPNPSPPETASGEPAQSEHARCDPALTPEPSPRESAEFHPRESPESQPRESSESSPRESAESQPRDSSRVSLGARVLAAAKASLPEGILERIQTPQARRRGSQNTGRAGNEQASLSRGRPVGTRAGEFRTGVRVSVIETLRAAAPWQPLRKRTGSNACIHVRKDDIRVVRFIRRSRCTTIFVVDASGSSALNRLAEVKGAVELMLAESYVRRDRVALISFRGVAAQVLLSPTNSVVRAKRELASLPGGGGTPLAIGIDTARVMADSLKRRGESPMIVVLTEGHPNITRDGKGNRARAEADAISAARLLRANAIASLLVDTAPRPRVMTEKFAREMGATYVPLPYANAGALASVVSECGRHANL